MNKDQESFCAFLMWWPKQYLGGVFEKDELRPVTSGVFYETPRIAQDTTIREIIDIALSTDHLP